MKHTTLICMAFAVAGMGLLAREAQFETAPYMNPKLSVEERMEDLLSKMTVREKVAVLCTTSGFKMYEIRDGEVYPTKALDDLYARFPGCGLGSFFRADWYSGRNWRTGLTPDLLVKAYNAMQRYAVERTRLGIPLGLGGSQMLGETSKPSGPALAAMFDTDLQRQVSLMEVRERRTFTQSPGLGFPQATLALDPRWSRCEQTYGEDPFLVSEYVYARCDAARQAGASSAIESFICHGMGEGGHMNTAVHVDDNDLFNVHMPPFVAAVRGGVGNIMTCYNLVGGTPGILRGDLVNGFLRDRLGYGGTMIGDAGAIGGLTWQGFAKDLGEAAALCVKNGNDLCCWEAENYLKGLMLAFERRLITEEDLNVSVRRVLRGRFQKGLFEHPCIDPAAHAKKYGRPEDVIGCAAHREIVLEAARKAMTLIENPKGVLPLNPRTLKRLAVIGPNADKPENQIGDYSAPQRPGQTTTPRMAFEQLGKKYGFEVDYQRGCKIRSLNKTGFAAAVEAAKKADAVVVCIGTSSVPDQALTQNEAGTAICNRIQRDTELDKDCGEGFDCSVLRLHGVQNDLLKALKATGKPVVAVLITGRPLVLEEIVANSDALLLAWYPGTEGGRAIAETVLGLNNPGGKLPISFPRAEGAIPCYYHQLRARNNYVDADGQAAYSFGYGLSYTTFAISKPKLDGNRVSVEVTNTGRLKGDDVIQLYVRDVLFSVARPRYALRGFRRVTLEPGETKTVSFELTAKELGFWNRERNYVVEPGDFRIWVTDSFSDEMETTVPSVTYTYGTPAAANVPKVILDTDMFEDYDDVGALAVLHKLADEGKCEILATVSSTRDNQSVAMCEVLNAYFGRPEIPVGAPAAPAVNRPSMRHYRKVVEKYAKWVRHANASDSEDAVRVYRRLLAAADDRSVTIAVIGFMTNVRRLLESGADDLSPLTGRELVARKVKRVAIVGFMFPRGREYNIYCDPSSARDVLENCPAPLVISGWEFGCDVYSGRKASELRTDGDPVTDMFAACLLSREAAAKARRSDQDPEGMGHNSYDQTAVLAAVLGDCDYFAFERGTVTMVGEKGDNVWRAHPDGPHAIMKARLPKRALAAYIDDLMAQGPILSRHGVLCLTFDDGLFDCWRPVLPLFAKYGAHATFYASGEITPAREAAMREFRAAGHSVGLHTVHHRAPPVPCAGYAAKKWFEEEVRPQLALTNFPITTFAYPNNRNDAQADLMLEGAAGFTKFRTGAMRCNYGGPGPVADFAQQDMGFIPVGARRSARPLWAFGIGPTQTTNSYYRTTRENVFGALRRAAEQNEIVSFFSHSIRPGNTDRIGMESEFLEEILKEAARLGMRVVGVEELDR